MPIDGHNATKNEMRQIKEVCRRLKNRYKAKNNGKPFDWVDLFNDKMKLGVGAGYESNLGKGSAGQETVLAIYEWLIAHELDFAASIAPDLFNSSMTTNWQSFVDERGTYGALHTRLFATGGLHEISALHPISETRPKIGQDFYFELESAINGAIIALDHYKGDWFPVPLWENKSLAPVPVTAGMNAFPVNERKAIVPLRQRHYPGEHGHCFIVGPRDLLAYYANHFVAGQAILPAKLDDIAMRLAEVEPHKIAIHLENVIFG